MRYADPENDGVFFHFDNHWYGYSRKSSGLTGGPQPGYTALRYCVQSGSFSLLNVPFLPYRDFTLEALKSIGFSLEMKDNS